MKNVNLQRFKNVKALIVGDVMLDRYWWGKVSRISPEAPVPVINLEKTSLAAGGAANVAANIAGLGAKPFLVGVIGDDDEAKLISGVLAKTKVSCEYLTKIPKRKTTVKTRIIAHQQQVARLDQESKEFISAAEEEKIWRTVKGLIEKIDIVIVSDYAKGILTENLLSRLITAAKCKNKYVLIDPKGKNYAKYKNATLLTPNRFELAEACKLEDGNWSLIEESGRSLMSELSLDALLITRGEEGMTLMERDAKERHLPAVTRDVYDVTGAGDTVIACLAAAIGSGANFYEAAKIANVAAGLVIEHIGTTPINTEMLQIAS